MFLNLTESVLFIEKQNKKHLKQLVLRPDFVRPGVRLSIRTQLGYTFSSFLVYEQSIIFLINLIKDKMF